MNSLKIAAALRILALAFETPEGDAPEQPAEPAKATGRGRGRPAKGEETAAPATGAAVPSAESSTVATGAAAASSAGTQTTAPASVVADDPFDPKPAGPVATLEEVRAALKAVREASTQENALAILKKAGDAGNLTDLKAEKYGVVVAAANVELRIRAASKPSPVVEADPFGETTTPAAPEKALTLEDVKAVIVATQKRTSQDAVQQVVMANGGKANKPDGGGEGPSLKALPEANFAATVAALKALPTTK